METQGFKIIDDLAVMGSDFFEDTPPVPSHLCNKKRKTFLVNIYPDVNCAIIHLITSNLYAIIPVLVVTFLPTLYR